MEPLDVIATTADAAFGTDQDGRIVVWNRPAERLLGHDAARVLGKPCHEVICGKDLFGNRFCTELCAVSRMARMGEPVHHFEMDVRQSSGEMLRAAFSIMMVPGPKPGRYTLIHLLRPASRGREADVLLRRVLDASSAPDLPAADRTPSRPAAAPPPLTDREIEILRLMAAGRSTQEIAGTLFISKVTVRTHIQNILRKLDVHSKLEAVSLALRTHLV